MQRQKPPPNVLVQNFITISDFTESRLKTSVPITADSQKLIQGIK